MRNLYLVFIAVLAVSCQTKSTQNETATSGEKLLIHRTTSIGDIQHSTDSVFQITSDHFEADLAFVLDSGELYADKVVTKSNEGEPFRLIMDAISDEKGETLKFNSEEDFIKFMAVRGYKVTSRKKIEMRTMFLFDK